MVKFGEIREYKSAYVLPPEGNFCLEPAATRPPDWDHCREKFAAKFNSGVSGFYFSHPAGKGLSVASFLHKCESVVGICDLTKPHVNSSFSFTERDTILWVVPSDFWRECEMKRSLLTILLRCGMYYDSTIDNFDDCLFSEEYKENRYARDTRSAIVRFLFGFTRWTEPPRPEMPTNIIKHGWVEEFRNAEIPMVRRKLALPEGEAREKTILGAESLWA